MTALPVELKPGCRRSGHGLINTWNLKWTTRISTTSNWKHCDNVMFVVFSFSQLATYLFCLTQAWLKLFRFMLHHYAILNKHSWIIHVHFTLKCAHTVIRNRPIRPMSQGEMGPHKRRELYAIVIYYLKYLICFCWINWVPLLAPSHICMTHEKALHSSNIKISFILYEYSDICRTHCIVR